MIIIIIFANVPSSAKTCSTPEPPFCSKAKKKINK